MKILFYEWFMDGCLKETAFKHMQIIDATSSQDVFNFARDIFDHGLNVSIRRSDEGEQSIIIFASKTNFGQKG